MAATTIPQLEPCPKSIFFLFVVVPSLLLFGIVFALINQAGSSGSSAASTPPSWLPDNSETPVSLFPGAPAPVYAFNANPTQPTLLALQATTPGFEFAAQIFDANGAVIGQFESRLQVAALALAPGELSYRLKLQSSGTNQTGSLIVAIGAAAAARSSPPAAILNRAAPPCQIMAAGSASSLVRSAPSDDYAVIGTLASGSLLPVLGRTDAGWYAVNFAERQGWIASEVATLIGQCDPVQRLLSPVIPAATADPDVYLLDIDRDGSGQLRDAISTPLGDANDLVWVRAINLYTSAPNNYREFRLTLNCTGVGAEHLRWGSPYEPTLRCGETVAMPFLFQINQQPIAVVFEANSPQGYVEYMLTVASTSNSVPNQSSVPVLADSSVVG